MFSHKSEFVCFGGEKERQGEVGIYMQGGEREEERGKDKEGGRDIDMER